MELFRLGPRTSVERIQLNQSSFDWLNESAELESARARQVLQYCFNRYSCEHQSAFSKRFHSAGDDYISSIVELYAHEMLLQCGYKVTPDCVTATGSKPDFLIEHDGYKAYVEVTVDIGINKDRRESKRTDDLFMETSKRLKTSGFGIALSSISVGNGNPSPTALARFLDSWFSSLDHAMEHKKQESGGANGMPQNTYEELVTGWKFSMGLVPLDLPTNRLANVAEKSTWSGWLNRSDRLAENIREKCRQHKNIELPLVLVVACNDFASKPDTEDIGDALLGTSQWTVSLNSTTEPIYSRQRNGLWSPTNPQMSRRPTDLVILNEVTAWTFEKVRPELWDNPNCKAETAIPKWIFRRHSWPVSAGSGLVTVSGSQQTLSLPSKL